MMRVITGLLALLTLCGLVACQEADEGGANTAASSGWATDDEGAVASSTEPASKGGQQTAAAPAWGNAPDFSYRTFDGRTAKLSDHHGKPVVVNFWAAWCPPCKQEMPHFDEVYQGQGGAFELIAVAIDQRNDPAAYFAAQGFSYTGAMDLDGAASTWGRRSR